MARVHLFGASGSGTTTLGATVACALGCEQYDTDTYFWMPTDPPFHTIRERAARQARLLRDLERSDSWVLSGSLCGWGDFAIPFFDLVVFLWLPTVVRMRRLKKREVERFGPEIDDPADPRYPKHREFLDWAAAYDTAGLDTRSKARHEEWISALPGRVARIEAEQGVDEHLRTVLAALPADPQDR